MPTRARCAAMRRLVERRAAAPAAAAGAVRDAEHAPMARPSQQPTPLRGYCGPESTAQVHRSGCRAHPAWSRIAATAFALRRTRAPHWPPPHTGPTGPPRAARCRRRGWGHGRCTTAAGSAADKASAAHSQRLENAARNADTLVERALTQLNNCVNTSAVNAAVRARSRLCGPGPSQASTGSISPPGRTGPASTRSAPP